MKGRGTDCRTVPPYVGGPNVQGSDWHRCVKQVGLWFHVFFLNGFCTPKASKLQDIFGNHNFLLTEDCKTDLRPKEDWPGAKRSWHLGLQVVLVGLL